jgi:hypothetical protein
MVSTQMLRQLVICRYYGKPEVNENQNSGSIKKKFLTILIVETDPDPVVSWGCAPVGGMGTVKTTLNLVFGVEWDGQILWVIWGSGSSPLLRAFILRRFSKLRPILVAVE